MGISVWIGILGILVQCRYFGILVLDRRVGIFSTVFVN